jgi:hypothetical protein
LGRGKGIHIFKAIGGEADAQATAVFREWGEHLHVLPMNRPAQRSKPGDGMRESLSPGRRFVRCDAEPGNGWEGALFLAEEIHHGIRNNCIQATIWLYREPEENRRLRSAVFVASNYRAVGAVREMFPGILRGNCVWFMKYGRKTVKGSQWDSHRMGIEQPVKSCRRIGMGGN